MFNGVRSDRWTLGEIPSTPSRTEVSFLSHFGCLSYSGSVQVHVHIFVRGCEVESSFRESWSHSSSISSNHMAQVVQLLPNYLPMIIPKLHTIPSRILVPRLNTSSMAMAQCLHVLTHHCFTTSPHPLPTPMLGTRYSGEP